jgi:hypothetical protein
MGRTCNKSLRPRQPRTAIEMPYTTDLKKDAEHVNTNTNTAGGTTEIVL